MVLRGSPALMEAVNDRHNIRQMSIGLRTHLTPLNLATLSAAIATDRLIQPTLLKQLNGTAATPATTGALGIRSDRIRAGMQQVVTRGTAGQAFKGHEFDQLRPHLHAKTGTAPLQLKGVNDKEHKLNNAWLTGWLEAGAIPGINKRIAFTCMVTHSRHTGGKTCGTIVADLLRKMGKVEEPRQRVAEQGL